MALRLSEGLGSDAGLPNTKVEPPRSSGLTLPASDGDTGPLICGQLKFVFDASKNSKAVASLEASLVFGE